MGARLFQLYASGNWIRSEWIRSEFVHLLTAGFGTALPSLRRSKIRHSGRIADMPPARRGLGYAGL